MGPTGTSPAGSQASRGMWTAGTAWHVARAEGSRDVSVVVVVLGVARGLGVRWAWSGQRGHGGQLGGGG